MSPTFNSSPCAGRRYTRQPNCRVGCMLVPFTATMAEPVRRSASINRSTVSGSSLRLSFMGPPQADGSQDAERDLLGGTLVAQVVSHLHPQPVDGRRPVLQRESVPLHLVALARQANRLAERHELQSAGAVVLCDEEPVLEVQVRPAVDGVGVRSVDLIVERELVAVMERVVGARQHAQVAEDEWSG